MDPDSHEPKGFYLSSTTTMVKLLFRRFSEGESVCVSLRNRCIQGCTTTNKGKPKSEDTNKEIIDYITSCDRPHSLDRRSETGDPSINYRCGLSRVGILWTSVRTSVEILKEWLVLLYLEWWGTGRRPPRWMRKSRKDHGKPTGVDFERTGFKNPVTHLLICPYHETTFIFFFRINRRKTFFLVVYKQIVDETRTYTSTHPFSGTKFL